MSTAGLRFPAGVLAFVAGTWPGPAAQALQVVPTDPGQQVESHRIDLIAAGDYASDSWQAHHQDADDTARQAQHAAEATGGISDTALYEPELLVTLLAALAAAGFVIRRRGPV